MFTVVKYTHIRLRFVLHSEAISSIQQHQEGSRSLKVIVMRVFAVQ